MTFSIHVVLLLLGLRAAGSLQGRNERLRAAMALYQSER